MLAPSSLMLVLLSPAAKRVSVNEPRNRYTDTAPPPGWQPKSAFFKAIFEKAKLAKRSKKVTLTCPDCGVILIIEMTIE